MLIYHPNEAFAKRLANREFVIDSITNKDEAVNFKFVSGDDTLLLKLSEPKAYVDDTLLEDVPLLGGAHLLDFNTYSVYERGYVPATHSVNEMTLELEDGQTIVVKGERL